MLGHEDVAAQVEAVGAAGLLDDVFDDVFGLVGGEVGEAAIAAKGE